MSRLLLAEVGLAFIRRNAVCLDLIPPGRRCIPELFCKFVGTGGVPVGVELSSSCIKLDEGRMGFHNKPFVGGLIIARVPYAKTYSPG